MATADFGFVASCGHPDHKPFPLVLSEAAMREILERCSAKPCRSCRIAAGHAKDREIVANMKASGDWRKGNTRKLPEGTVIAFVKESDGTWSGSLSGIGHSATSKGPSLHHTFCDLMLKTRRWARAGLISAPAAIPIPGPPKRTSSKSVVDRTGDIGLLQRIAARRRVEHQDEMPREAG